MSFVGSTMRSKGIIPAIHRELATRLYYIETNDYGPLKKKMVELYGYPKEHIERGIAALKQYYAVALLDPANPHAVSSTLDPFWHAHMLFSRQYAEFCNMVVGEFMHHEPLDKEDSKAVADVMRKYAYTLEVLPKLFTDIDTLFWPPISLAGIICWHGGNQHMYAEVQEYRLFPPRPEFQLAA